MARKNNNATTQDVYNIVNRLEDKIDRRLKEIANDVERNSEFRNQMMGRMAIIAGVIGLVINIAMDWFLGKK